MAYAMILFPLLAAPLSAAFPSNRFRPWILPFAAVVQSAMTAVVLSRPGAAAGSGWITLDPVGKLFLLIVSMVFLVSSFYAAGYLRHRSERSNRTFVPSLLVFLGLANIICWSHHLGLIWVAIEGTTLATAPLIYFNHTRRCIEATWKYLLVGSVGIALALLGTFFLAYALLRVGIVPTLILEDLLRLAPRLSGPWFRAGFILLLVGYGTKMGLAPMHTWKPDTYGEAPGVVGAVLAGGVTSVAFLAFLRVYQIGLAAGDGAFMSRILVVMGLFSMAVAGLFMLGMKDFKRTLAYSSVEHMGILIFGLGIGLPALFGTLLHVLVNAAAKGILFLSAGNIQRAYGSKNIDTVRGAFRRLTLSGILFFTGFVAVTGSPPFGTFVSEFSILNAAFGAGNVAGAALFLLFLLVVFIGMGGTVLAVVFGEAPAHSAGTTAYRDDFWTTAPIVVLIAVVLYLGFAVPAPLNRLLTEAARFLEAGV